MTAIEKLMDALAEAGCEYRQSGDGYIAQCPAHDDEHPSLSIGLGDDGRVLLNCHAGCDTKAVVAALGLTMVDLFGGYTFNIALSRRMMDVSPMTPA